MPPLQLDIRSCRYQAMIGVGGIGSGVFFALHGDHTLGREESRGGHFLDRRDYCKLHIISHYVKSLLGPEFSAILVGKVGHDDIGHRLLDEMTAAGLDLRYVETCPGAETLYSFCFVYPDGSGGNLTTDDSACTRVRPEFVATAEPEFARFEGRGIALAAPEVPIDGRAKLLQLGTAHHFFRVASFVSAELPPAIEMGMLHTCDLLALNLDEAATLAETSMDASQPLAIVEAAVNRLHNINPDMALSITAGKNGSWSWDGESLFHVAALRTKVVSSAGAGDAHLSGFIAGLVAGLTIPQAQELATLVAALSVTSPHTINKEIDRLSLERFAAETRAPLSDPVRKLLEARGRQ